MLDDKIYAIGDYQMFELIDGEYVNERYYNTETQFTKDDCLQQ